ncbi:hypothetical protein NW762_008839 [Fusarium torreyae]|uniref:Uncharacterized protein n=1 Tax=Fusarium torreyae TaxID=1237075 RepID=A0A9W8VCA6_9HYPO|nr:hypothetical protein NW762_008839 [Fusarium torreyae]
MGKTVHLPHEILWELAYRNIMIYNVVPKCKKYALSEESKSMIDSMKQTAAIWGNTVTSKIRTITHDELFRKLRECRDQGTWNDLTRKAFRSNTLILIDVDLDFSADFLLALNAAVVYTATYAEQNPQASMRLATMSWESIHPFIAGLYELWDDSGIHNFQIQFDPSHEFHHIRVGSGNMGTILETIKAYVSHLGPDQRHTILRFDDVDLIPDEWLDDAWIVPWVPSQHRHRVIFDRMTRQAVRVATKMAISERQQQMIWPWKMDIEQSRICVYTSDEYLVPQESDPPRRMDAVNQHLGGFVAALASFNKWPVKTMDMLHLFGSDEKSAINEMSRRFQLQGILQASVEDSAIRIGLTLPTEVHDLFFKLLPEVCYDSRIAHFLVLPSTPRLVQVKIQAAASMLVGSKKMAKVDWSMQGLDSHALDQIRDLAASGRTSNIAGYGTLWSKLGLMKSTWAKYNNGMCGASPANTMVDGRVSLPESTCSNWTNYHTQLRKQLRRGGVTSEPMRDVFAEPHDIGETEHESLCWDFVQAYACQIACVEIVDGMVSMTDFVSGTKLACVSDISMLIPWVQFYERDENSLVGFYTAAFRNPKSMVTRINDWNWIPSKVWVRWNRELRDTGRGGTASFQTPHVSSENPDEV